MSAIEVTGHQSTIEVKARQRKPRGTRPTGPVKPCPWTRDQLDSRTTAARLWDLMEDRIIADCGGEDNLTTVQRTLITAFCAVSLQLSDLNVKALLGQPVSLGELSLAAGTLKRLAGSIGLARVPKEVTTLDAYIRAKYPQQPTSEIA